MARSRGGSGRPKPTRASASPAAWRVCECVWERRMIETDDFLADLERYLHEAAERRDEGAPARRPLPGRGLAAVALALAGVAVVIALGRGALSSPPDDVAATPPSVTPWRTPTP